VTIYLRIGESTQLTTSPRVQPGSPRHHGFNLSESSQKSTRFEICKKISTKSSSNSWWAKLTSRFQLILTALFLCIRDFEVDEVKV